jgi:hypothetical protein
MANLELEHTTSNTAEQRTWLIATPHDLGPSHLMDFVGEYTYWKLNRGLPYSTANTQPLLDSSLGAVSKVSAWLVRAQTMLGFTACPPTPPASWDRVLRRQKSPVCGA